MDARRVYDTIRKEIWRRYQSISALADCETLTSSERQKAKGMADAYDSLLDWISTFDKVIG